MRAAGIARRWVRGIGGGGGVLHSELFALVYVERAVGGELKQGEQLGVVHAMLVAVVGVL